MAVSQLHHRVLILLPFNLLLLLLHTAPSTASHHRRHKGYKSLHLTLYQHETYNKTAYTIVNGVAGAPFGPLTSPFGTLSVLHDPLTLSPNATSKVVGSSEGFSITSSFDGLEGTTVAKFTISLDNYEGSISVVGVTHNTKPSDHAVVGGTGDFLLVQGYVTSSPVVITGLTFVYKAEFHLYWPPYAIHSSSSSS